MIVIRPIQKEEIAECVSLMKLCFEESLWKIFFLKEESTLVAVEEARIIGGINLTVYPLERRGLRMGYIGWLYTHPDARGRGIASELVSAAIAFMKKEGCTDIGLCIEGDNPSSFRNISSRDGFGIMSLPSQLARFGLDTFKIWKKASRFFDMGYFLWHYESKGSSLYPSASRQVLTFLLTVVLNTILFLPKLLWLPSSAEIMLIPALALALRTLFLLAGGGRIYLPWDTAWLSALLASFLPISFPSPGGVYPQGDKWSLKEKEKGLGISALATVIMEAVLVVLFSSSPAALAFLVPLLLLDTLLPFYPFCGFLSSRLKRYFGKRYHPFVIILLLVTAAGAFLNCK